jgi:hypothetical protein
MAHTGKTPLTDPTVLKQFYTVGPRHTAYPSTDRFVEAFGPEDHSYAHLKHSVPLVRA